MLKKLRQQCWLVLVCYQITQKQNTPQTSMCVKLSEHAPVFSPSPCILQPAQSAKGMPDVFAFLLQVKTRIKQLQHLKILLSANCLFLYLKERPLSPQLNDVQGAHALFMLLWQGMTSRNLRAITEELYWILLQCSKMFNALSASCLYPRLLSPQQTQVPHPQLFQYRVQ